MKTYRIFTTGGDILAEGDGIRRHSWPRDTVEVYVLPPLINEEGEVKPLAQINAETRVAVTLYGERVLGYREEAAPGSAVMVTLAPVSDLRPTRGGGV